MLLLYRQLCLISAAILGAKNCDIHLHKAVKIRIGMDLLFKLPTLKSAKVVEFHQFHGINVLSCCKSMEHIVSFRI